MTLEIHHIQHGGKTIEYTLRRSLRRKRTVALSVTKEGVIISAPAHASMRNIRKIIERRAAWIATKATEIEEARQAAGRACTDGGIIKYLGLDYTLSLVTEESEPQSVTIRGGDIIVGVPALMPDSRRNQYVGDALRQWYEESAQEEIAAAVERCSSRTGLVPTKVRVKDLTRSWGICNPSNSITFNWRLVLAPVRIIDYIVVHELCHITHKNHSSAFYDAVAAIQPDYKDRRLELRRLAPQLELL